MNEPLLARGLFHEVLVRPALELGVDTLNIVSGYATPSMVSHHMAVARSLNLHADLRVDLTVGMTATDGLRLDHHRGFQKLLADSQVPGAGFRFTCGYVMAGAPAVHAKIYVWSKNDEPLVAFSGSANYSRIGMGVVRNSDREEVCSRVDPRGALEYVKRVAAGRIEATDPDVQAEIVVYRERAQDAPDVGSDGEDDQFLVHPRIPLYEDHVSLTLLSSTTGRVHNPGGGLNHGQRDSRANKNEAYIPVPMRVQMSQFFPPPGEHFLVSTDDGKVLIMSTGSGEYGKDLRTPLRNGDLGEYLRFRMGIANGAPFTDQDFSRYGRTSVDFYKVDEETYFMDFAGP
jgi:hypothetical protein